MKNKNIFTIIFFIVAFVVLPSVARAEYIDSFVSDINIGKDSVANIIEKISYVFTEDRHGIFRCIPTIHQDKASSFFKERYIDIEFKSITMDNHEVPYTEYTSGNELCVKIGDPATTINGAHRYDISYSASGAVAYQQYGGAELYWNVTGNDWTVPIHSVEALVSSGDPILLRERACYQGVVGKINSCQITVGANSQIHFSGTQFNPGEGLTIAQALDQSKIAHDVRERYNLMLIIPILILIIICISAYALYRYKTKFKTGNTIIPQYEPYPGVKPMYAGYLFDKRLDPQDITAGIVYLAEQGFIRIKKIDKKVLFFFEVDDYEVELLKLMDEVGDTFEKQILALIFYNFSEIGSKITLSDLKNNYAQAKENFKKLNVLRQALLKDLIEKGFFMKADFFSHIEITFTVFLFVVASVVGVFLLTNNGLPAVVIGIILSLLFGIFATGRRTRKGYEALDYLKGFKDFLRVTETQRYIFHNAPEKNAEQFMEYLPYAIAFGVEKEWAKTFEGITIPNPNWYDGGSSMSSFSAVGLSQSLGGFSSAFTASSGAGGSASSGGGSSGGGGGGGGGGSW